MTYYLLLIGLGAFCLLLLLGLIVAARQRPTRHERTLEHIEELEKGLGLDAERASLPPEQVEAERAQTRRPGSGS